MPLGGQSWHIGSAPSSLKINEGQRLTGINLYGQPTYSYPPWLIPNLEPWDWNSEESEEFKVQVLRFIKVLQDEESRLGKDHSFSVQMKNQHENGTFWHLQAM